MRVSSKLLSIGIGIALIGVGIFLIATRAMPTAPPAPPPPPSVDVQNPVDTTDAPVDARSQYTDEQYEVSFEYPSGPNGYIAIDAPTEPSIFRFVTFYKKEEWESFQQSVDAREGPTGISYAVMDASGATDARTWIEQSPLSQLSQGGKLLGPALVGTTPGERYRFDGLYGAQSVVAIHAGRAYVFSVTYIDPADPQVRDFEQLLQSVVISAPAALDTLSAE
jgi:hypothetical protein